MSTTLLNGEFRKIMWQVIFCKKCNVPGRSAQLLFRKEISEGKTRYFEMIPEKKSN